MNPRFKQVENHFKQLESQFATGALSEADFKAELEKLMFQDEQGNWWVMGYETKQWYRYNGKEWVQDIPNRQWTTKNIIISFTVVAVFVVLGVWGIVYSLKSTISTGEPGPAGPVGPEGPAGPEGPVGPAGSIANQTCAECHNNSGLIPGIKTEWRESLHGTGEAYLRGTSASCAGCHSGVGFTNMVSSGQRPDEVEDGTLHPTRQDCYSCHQIHDSYSTDDWALTTTDPVSIYAFEGVVYDGGKGNLCAHCHQPRSKIEEADTSGIIEVTSTHWGPHHGPNSTLLLGVGGAGDVKGNPAAHYSMVEDTCVTCHMGENNDHSFDANIEVCQQCHADALDFDINGVQTEIQMLQDELETALITKGMWENDTEGGYPVVGSYPAAEAQAMWNYIFIAMEDSSLGVHNPAYTKDLLEWSIGALTQQ